MATPKTNNIAFSNLNTEILQATSTAQCSLSTAGARMGYTTNISMSSLMGCFGGTITAGRATANKYVPQYDGYDSGGVISGDSISNGTYTAGGRISSIYEVNDNGTTIMAIDDGAGGNPPTGYQGTDIDRICYADTSRTLGVAATGTKEATYSMPASGSVTFGVRFV